MSAAARSSSICLGRHTGDERRRLVSPLRAADVLLFDAALYASTASPFDRWQSGRNPYSVQHGAARAPILLLQTNAASGAGRMLRSKPIIGADLA